MSTDYPGAVAKDTRTYMTILGSDGSLRIKSEEGVEGAIKREWEKDGESGVKWEKVYNKVIGTITNLEMYEGEYGDNILITLSKGNAEITLSISVSSPYGEDFLKKAPNIDIEEEVELAPYCFEDEHGKIKKGITIRQNGEKLVDFFKKKEGDQWVHMHGLPEPKGDVSKYKTEKWKVYYGEVRIFLTEYFEENVIPKVATLQDAQRMVQNDKADIPTEDIPF
jgi:hypothetical protein